MERSTAVKMPYLGFEKEVYTLLVGPSRQRLNVQIDVMKRIPLFNSAVHNGEVKQDVPYDLQSCDAEALAKILAYVRDGKLPDMGTDRCMKHPSRNTKVLLGISNHIMAYQLALELDLEAAQNALVDSMCPLLVKVSVDKMVCTLNPPQTSKFRSSKMHLLLSRHIAFKLRKQARDRCDIPSQDDILELARTLENWHQDDMIVVMAHLLKPIKDSPIEAAMHDPCQFHSHTQTEQCVPELVEKMSNNDVQPSTDSTEGTTVADDAGEKEEGIIQGAKRVRNNAAVQNCTKQNEPSMTEKITTPDPANLMQQDYQGPSEPNDDLQVDNTAMSNEKYSGHEAMNDPENAKDSDNDSWDMASDISTPGLSACTPNTLQAIARARKYAEESTVVTEEECITQEQEDPSSPHSVDSAPIEDKYVACDHELSQDDIWSGRDTRGYHRGKRNNKQIKTPMMRVDKYGNLR